MLTNSPWKCRPCDLETKLFVLFSLLKPVGGFFQSQQKSVTNISVSTTSFLTVNQEVSPRRKSNGPGSQSVTERDHQETIRIQGHQIYDLQAARFAFACALNRELTLFGKYQQQQCIYHLRIRTYLRSNLFLFS
jgi:hypothetical protein